jgi:hypothetical protein
MRCLIGLLLLHPLKAGFLGMAEQVQEGKGSIRSIFVNIYMHAHLFTCAEDKIKPKKSAP